MDTLYRHLHKWMTEPFVWGQCDCMLVLADYLIDLGYPDIGAKWRGTYDSALSCQRVSGFLTDPVRPLAAACAEFGIPETDRPARGDMGVVTFTDTDRVKSAGALYLGKNWAIKGEHRVVIGPAKVLKAWRCVD